MGEFAKFFEVADRIAKSLNNVLSRGHDKVEPVQKIILNLGLLAASSLQEIMILVGNGCGPGAMKIARTLLETGINAEYLRKFPDEFEDYFEWHHVERYKLLLYIRQNMPGALAEIGDPIDIEQNFERVKSRFVKSNGDVRGSWCKLDLGSRGVRVGFHESYKLLNPIASGLIHGTMGALVIHARENPDSVRIGISPSLNFCQQALVSSHHCALRIVETVAQTFRVEPEPSLEQLAKDYTYAWQG